MKKYINFISVNESNQQFKVGDKVIYISNGVRKYYDNKSGEILEINYFDSLGTSALMLFDEPVIEKGGAYSYELKRYIPNTSWVSILYLFPQKMDQYEDWD